jgi:hypothetical protein
MPGWRRCSTRCRPRSASSARPTGLAAMRSTFPAESVARVSTTLARCLAAGRGG